MSRKLAILFSVVLVFSLVSEVVEAGLLDKIKEAASKAKDKFEQAKDKVEDKIDQAKDKIKEEAQELKDKIQGVTQDPSCKNAADQAGDCKAKASLCDQGTYIPLMNRICKKTCCDKKKKSG